jgi:hypothetical protein
MTGIALPLSICETIHAPTLHTQGLTPHRFGCGVAETAKHCCCEGRGYQWRSCKRRQQRIIFGVGRLPEALQFGAARWFLPSI